MSAFSYDIIVPGTLYALLGLSIITWVLIALKAAQVLRNGQRNRRFKEAFWHAADLEAAQGLAGHDGPIARLSQAGLKSIADTDHPGNDLEHTGDRQDLLERALRQQIQRERRSLESGLAMLASVGSTAPFVGLFGTVWGIMYALTQIGVTGSASLEVVAGPIGEALIATAVGIAVAVPAVLAYNFFLRRLKLSAADLDDFAADLISLARKTGYRLRRVEIRAVGSEAKESKPSAAAVVKPLNNLQLHGATA